jgi:hypothetical protein
MTGTTEAGAVGMAGLRERYDADGFATSGGPVLGGAAVEGLRAAVEAVIRGDYDTGRPPYVTNAGAGVAEPPLVKIDQPHLASTVIAAAVRDPAIAELAARATGAQSLQVFAVQLLKKSPGGRTAGNVGWHQDDQYWSGHIEGNAFTLWLALSDVTERSGAVKFVRGSHEWGRVDGGSFFDQDVEEQQRGLRIPEGASWQEVPAVLPPGWASLHHRMTVHGSGENLSDAPRYSLAIHMRTEQSSTVPGSLFGAIVNDPVEAPVIYSG